MVSNRLSQLIGQEALDGWRLLAVDGDYAVLKRPNYGSLLGHVIIFFLTVWFTLGLGNVAYGLYCFLTSSEYQVLSVSEPINQEEALTLLRRRYAAGKLTEEEFEKHVEHLLETESITEVRRSMYSKNHSPPISLEEQSEHIQ